MAEAIAIISLISSITQLAEFSSKLAKRINEFVSATPELPPCFQHISASLPLLTHVVRALYQKAYSGNLTVENQRDLLFVIQSLEKELRELSDLIQSIIPDANARRWERGIKAIKSVKIQKSVEAVQVRIEGYMGNLNAYLNLRNSDGIDTLVEATRNKGSIEENNRIEKKRRISMLDLDREENFVGREHVMHSVDERFNAGGRRVAIVGIGGVGKSRIAIEHCHVRMQNEPELDVFWANGADRAKFEAAYRRLARLLKIPGREVQNVDILQLVRDHLSDEVEKSWLMVLDNADNRTDWLESGDRSIQPLVQYLPRSAYGRILVTTRDSQLGHRLTEGKHEPIQIHRFDQNEASTLLRSKLADGSTLRDEDAHELTAALGHLPLTITQAAAYLTQIDMSAMEYLSAFRAGLADIPELLMESVDDPIRDRETSNSIFQAWRLSFDVISKQNGRAAEILSLMAMLDRQSVSKDLLLKSDETLIQFKAAIAKLKAFSFITEENQASRYSMHRLVQLSTRKWIEVLGKQSHFIDMAYAAVATVCPEDADYNLWPTFVELQPHVNVILDYDVGKDSSETLIHRSKILHSFGRYAMSKGQKSLAGQYLGEARTIRQEQLGPENEATLATTGYFGVVYGMLNVAKRDEAQAIQQQVLQTSERVLGPNHPLTLKSMSRLAVIYGQRKDHKRAKRMQVEVLKNMEDTLGLEHRHTLCEMGHLLYTLIRLRQWQEADKVGQRALNLEKKVLGTNHPDTVTIMAQVCIIYNAQRRWEEATQLEEQVLFLRLQALGPDHPKSLSTMESLAHKFKRQERPGDAERLLKFVVETRTQKLGVEHHDTIAATQQLRRVQEQYSPRASDTVDPNAKSRAIEEPQDFVPPAVDNPQASGSIAEPRPSVSEARTNDYIGQRGLQNEREMKEDQELPPPYSEHDLFAVGVDE